MKRLISILFSIILVAALSACVAAGRNEAAAETAAAGPADTPTAAQTQNPPTEPPAPETLRLPEAQEGWADAYLAFLSDNYDIFAALWPEGLTGVGFVDLDLDGTPELVLFDPGASATMGVQLFDLVDGQVYCVSSVLDSAAGAFGGEYFSPVAVCASYFDDFRLCRTEDGWCFWTDSANGTMETSWNDIIRFDSADGVLTPTAVCGRYSESDIESGRVTFESYSVGGDAAEAAAYEAAASRYIDAADTGYDAKGVFLWNDMTRYDTTYDGLMVMARDAVSAYVPIEG